MKKVISFILAFIMIIGSVASAAPGDIIYTGENNKLYKKGNQGQLATDIMKGADVNKFYREVENGKFVNIVEEENAQLDYILDLMNRENLITPKDLADYINAKNTEIEEELKNLMVPKDFDDIDDLDKGTIEDYFGDPRAPKLTPGENYSNPVAGSTDGTSQIINLSLPKGASKWIYKVGEDDFVDLKFDTVVTGSEYSSGRNITVEPGQYLLLAAVDGGGKLKAYASIEILEGMIRQAKVELENEDESIIAEIKKSEKHSGGTTVEVTSSPGEGVWKLAILDDRPVKVYKHIHHNNFNAIKYDDANIEHTVASHSELDKGLGEFKKYIIIYSEIDGQIDKYRIFGLDVNNVSGIFDAEALISEEVNPTDYNYSTPVPGSSAGTTKIVRLNLPQADTATKWMYAIVDDPNTKPGRDRIYSGSQPYEAGENIKINPEDNLMILATDDGGKVRAYGIVEKVQAGMIKNPLAAELKETTNYTKPVKGDNAGDTKLGLLKYDGVDKWAYKISPTAIDIPELGSPNTGTVFNVVNYVPTDDITIEDDSTELKSDTFRRNMMIYGLDSSDKVVVYKNFIMNDTNVIMPNITKQESPKLYEGNSKGSSANTTRFTDLSATLVPGSNLKFKYRVVDEDILSIEFNKQFTDAKDLKINTDVPVSVGKFLQILVVDGSNKTKAFTTIELSFENVKAGNAVPLDLTTNYKGPFPGSKNNSTQFTFLNLPAGADKFVYEIGDTSFGIPEAGSKLTGDLAVNEAKVNTDIEGVGANKYLRLLAVDNDKKIVAYREFRLSESQVKGAAISELIDGSYELSPGNTPSSTKLKLEPLGLENPTSIRWRYKLVDSDTYKPYLNEIVDGGIPYVVNPSTFMGTDIPVVKDGSDYGTILILATDSGGRTKGYAYKDITSEDVKEHAKEITEDLKLIKGTIIDSVRFDTLSEPTTENKYRYLISDNRPNTPAKGDNIPNATVAYDKVDGTYEDIQINIGKYLSLYEVDKDDKVVKFNSLEVEEVAQGTAKLKLTAPGHLLEGAIVKGGTTLTIELTQPTDAKWVADIVSTKSIRDKLFNGFKANSETSEWAKVVSAMVADGDGAISLDATGKVVTVYFPQTLAYDITKDQIISLTIPHEAMEGARNDVEVKDKITIKPTVGAIISGDVVNNIVREVDIIAGGKTIVITLVDGTWAGIDALTNNASGIINNFKSDQSINSNWDKIVTEIKKDPNKYVNRDNGSTVTITLPQVDAADIDFGTTPEVISLEIGTPSPLIPSATENVVANPDFILYPNRIQVEGKVSGQVIGEEDSIVLQAPDYKIIDESKHTWIIEVETGSLKPGITDKDLIITGLPRGLSANITQDKLGIDSKDRILIKLTGVASGTLADKTKVKVKIKGSAVNEPNAEDSEEIELELIKGDSIIDGLIGVKINVVEGKLIGTTDKMEYTLDFTNGSKDLWVRASNGETIDLIFIPGRVYVREEANPRVLHEVTRLTTPKAPTRINVSEVDYSETDKVKVKLTGFDNELDYRVSTDKGVNWDDLTDYNSQIELNKDAELMVKLKATDKELASSSTPKLNGLYLGDVELQVGKGIINNTNQTMQYSLNSSNGIDGNWFGAGGNETPINFTDGNRVWIRQQRSNINYRELGIVTAEPLPDIKNKITYNIKDGTITNATTQDLEYKIGGGQWTELNPVTEVEGSIDNGLTKKVIFGPGPLEIRRAGTTSKVASGPKTLVSIPNPIDPPTLKGDDDKKVISYLLEDENKWVKLDDSFEYRIDINETWKPATDLDADHRKNESVIIYVRKVASPTILPSNEKTISFSKNITFENLSFNIANKVILGTTTDMEYSINSKKELNGIWKGASKGQTIIEPFEGMYIWLREKGKPNTAELRLEKLSRQAKPDPTAIFYNVSTGKIANDLDYNLEYRINNGEWIKIDARTHVYDVNFIPGKLEFRQRANINKLESLPIVRATIRARASGPKIVIDDLLNTITSINDLSDNYKDFEYRINPNSNSPWISGELLNTEDFSGKKLVEIRAIADNETLSSQVTEVEFTKNLELGHLRLSTHVAPHMLNGTTDQMEYRVFLEPSGIFNYNERYGWTDCKDENTALDKSLNSSDIKKIEIRDKNQPENKAEIHP